MTLKVGDSFAFIGFLDVGEQDFGSLALKWHEDGQSFPKYLSMLNKQQNEISKPGPLFSFILRVLRTFRSNQGLLLSGAVAYNTLLSIVPMSILVLIVLSHFIGEEQLFYTLSMYLEMLIPGYAAILTDQVRVFLAHRRVVGMIGLLFMLFFSSIAFMVLENAMSVILSHRGKTERRHFLISFIIPYAYLFCIGLAILLVSFIIGAIETLESRHLIIFGMSLSLEGASGIVLYILGIMGEVLMLTSIYLVMPVGHSQNSSRTHRRNNRNVFMGDHPSVDGLVLLGPVYGKYNLRFLRYGSGSSSRYRSRGRNYLVRCPGYCRTRTQDRRETNGF